MKFLYGYFNEQTGESIVTLANKYGHYTGYAYLHPDDKNNASQYAGCDLAEKRAWLDSLRKDHRRIKFQLKAIQNLAKDININCDYIDPKIKRRFNIQLKLYQSALDEIEEEIKELNESIEKSIKIREEILNRTKQNNQN